jgi:hypothetical protein
MALSAALVVLLSPVGVAGAAVSASHTVGHAAARRAPNGPPLGDPSASQSQSENVGGVPSAEGDQLVENGLASPLCTGSVSAELSSAAQSNCETSGFVGAPAPTNNYAFDVNINVGALGLSKGGLLSVIQDMFVVPVWSAIEWIVHALVVMLEWCYTLELLGGSTMSGVAHGLQNAERSFTESWLALVLATASILAFYNGLIRRRVADTLGQALLTLTMMAAGLWVIADPLGTVGAVGRWANQASLGTLGAVAQGTPANAPRTLGDSMRALFGGAIEMPWCYLEFGNVRWCSDPALLDPRLRKAALGIVATQQKALKCGSTMPSSCVSAGSNSALTIEHSAALVRNSDTNGKLFLAFPANKPERNSVKDSSSLLHVLCQAQDDTKCTGPTAAQAEFRSDNGTFPRMLGVVLIALGVLGMVMIFGLVALHLLIAAVVSLFMLLLAPFAVLAPALGESGRAIFGSWLMRTLGAVTSKLLFSFLLGALLSMQHILMSLPLLGWWTQWLLISACWWGVFLKRRQALAFLQNRGNQPASPGERRPIGRRIGGALETYGAVRHPLRYAKARFNSRVAPALPAPDEQLRKRGHGGGERKSKRLDEHRAHGPTHPTVPASQRQPASLRKPATARTRKREAMQPSEHKNAHPSYEDSTRHTALEAVRRSDRQPGRLYEPERHGADDQATQGALGTGVTSDTRTQTIRHEKQAQLKRVHGAREAARQDGEEKQAIRLDVRARRIEGELAHPQRAPGGYGAVVTGGANVPPRLPASRVIKQADRLSLAPDRQAIQPAFVIGANPAGMGDASADPPRRKSRIMDDAREVAEGRKRQLGYGPQR